MPDQPLPTLAPKVVLGIAAHPDDLDFGASGTMATFAAQGADVYYLLLTDGSKGSADPNITPEALIAMRQDEQKAAAIAIGAKEPRFLTYPDGGLEVTMELKRDIIKVIRELKPDVVITMDPSMLYSTKLGMINHPDHRAAGQATLDAVFPLARDHLSFPELFAEGFQPHKTGTVLLINFNEQNFYVDITDMLEAKKAALTAHTSQMPDLDRVHSLVTNIAAAAGKESGYAYAEAFIRIDVPA